MIRRENLKYDEYQRRSRICQWFLHQCNNRRFLGNFAIGDEAGFALNDAVINDNVRMYARANHQIFIKMSMIAVETTIFWILSAMRG